MGRVFLETEKYLNDCDDGIFLEIGSDRFEGSTAHFDQLAQQYGCQFITVDIDPECQKRFPQENQINFYLMTGSNFTQNILTTLNTKIKFLYLDNMDWNWSPCQPLDWIQDQINDYKTRFNIDLNNVACQNEHLQQMVNAIQYMAQHSVIVCDDTYQRYWDTQTYDGKCGAVIPFLLIHGYKIVYENHEEKGLILKR